MNDKIISGDKMEKRKKYFNIIFIIAFVLFNITNCFLVTSSNVIKNLLSYNYNFYMVISSLLGNCCILLFTIGIGHLIFKKEKNFRIYLLCFSLFFSILFFAMSVYCNYYGMMFNFENLDIIGGGTPESNFIFFFDTLPSLFRISVPFFFVSTILLFGLHIAYCVDAKKKEEKTKYLVKNIKKGLVLTISSIIILLLVNMIYVENNKGTYFEYNNDDIYSVQTKGVLNHYVNELCNLMFSTEKKLDEDDKTEALEQISTNSNKIIDNEYTNLFKDKNLLLIQMESINNFLIGLEIEINGEYVEVTPNLNQLVNNNIYCDNYYTNVGIGNTSDAEFSTITGLYSTGYSYSVYRYTNNEFETLPKLFKEKGYDCYSFHANIEKFYNRDIVHKDVYGFDKFYGEESLIVNDDNLVNHWLGDEDFLKQAIDIMNSTDNPSFAFAITISNHTPFAVPVNGTNDRWFKNKENLLPNNIKLSKNRSYNNTFKGYLEYVSYADYSIGKAIEYLKELNIYEDTVIILYGDHGIDSGIYEMFYESGNMFRNNINPIITNNNSNQKLLELQMLSNVPLIISSPLLEHKVISKTRNHVALSTTIANLFGLDKKVRLYSDCLSNDDYIAYNPKSGIIFMDNIIIDSKSKKYVNKSNHSIDVDEIIDNYYDIRDLNNKILNYDLLRIN